MSVDKNAAAHSVWIITAVALSVVVFWLVHKFQAHDFGSPTPKRLKDRIWLLEKVCLFALLALIGFSEIRSFSEQIADSFHKDPGHELFTILFFGLFGSGFLIVLADLADRDE